MIKNYNNKKTDLFTQIMDLEAEISIYKDAIELGGLDDENLVRNIKCLKNAKVRLKRLEQKLKQTQEKK